MTASRRIEIPARDMMPKALVDSDYFIGIGYVSPSSQKFYNNDRLNPYAYDEGEKFYWIRPGAVGGKSLIWGRWSFRWSTEDFEANKREGIGDRLADPLRRPRAVVRLCREIYRRVRLAREPAAAARQRVPAADADEHRREMAERAARNEVPGPQADQRPAVAT